MTTLEQKIAVLEAICKDKPVLTDEQAILLAQQNGLDATNPEHQLIIGAKHLCKMVNLIYGGLK
jgi:hypothetical protein